MRHRGTRADRSGLIVRRTDLTAGGVLFLLLASTCVSVLSVSLHRADAFQAGGQFASTVIGQANFSSVAPSLAPDSLNKPFKTAFDASGNLWVADENNHRVVEFKPPFTDGEAATLEIGQPDFATNQTTASQSSLFGPVGLAFDKNGDLWVSDFVDSRITEYVPPFSDGMNASLELGQPAGDLQFISHGQRPPSNGLAAPLDLKFDSAGDLWVTDRVDSRIVEYVPPFIDGASPSVVIGQRFLNTSVASTTQSGLNGPEAIAFDSAGNLWVTDENNNRVLEFGVASLKSNGPNAEVEIGQPAGPGQFLANSSALTASGFNAPVGLAFDSSGDLLVSDRANNRILGFKPPFSDGMSASFEIGQPEGPSQFTTNVFSLSQDSVQNPLGVSFDHLGNLWVADQANDRVLEFAGPASVTAGADAIVSGGVAGVDETSKTGFRLESSGVTSGSLVNFFSADLSSQPPGTGNAGLSNPVLFEAKVSGISGGTTNICIRSPNLPGSSQASLYEAPSWVVAAQLNGTAGVACLNIPTSLLNSVLLIAVGGSGAKPQSLGTVQIAAIAFVICLGLVAVGYIATRRRRRWGYL